MRIDPSDPTICQDCWESPTMCVCQERILAERREKQRKLEEVKNALGGQRALVEYVPEKFKVTEQNREAWQEANEFDPTLRNLYLWGKTGTGKTFLAAVSCRNYCLAGFTCLVVKPSIFLRGLRLAMMDPARMGEESLRIQEVIDSKMLIIDDMGKEKPSGWSSQIWYDIVDGRYLEDKKGMIITSEHDPERLGCCWSSFGGSALAGRLIEMCKVVHVGGKDHRRSK